MNKARRKAIKQWLLELDEDVPDDKLKEHIDILRGKLNEIADEYGRTSKNTLKFSQYLDTYIVRYLRKMMY